jgi:hypothetical protein
LTPNVELGFGLSASGSGKISRAQEPIAQSLILVELTGIEPVASWLQTRRSPS